MIYDLKSGFFDLEKVENVRMNSKILGPHSTDRVWDIIVTFTDGTEKNYPVVEGMKKCQTIIKDIRDKMCSARGIPSNKNFDAFNCVESYFNNISAIVDMSKNSEGNVVLVSYEDGTEYTLESVTEINTYLKIFKGKENLTMLELYVPIKEEDREKFRKQFNSRDEQKRFRFKNSNSIFDLNATFDHFINETKSYEYMLEFVRVNDGFDITSNYTDGRFLDFSYKSSPQRFVFCDKNGFNRFEFRVDENMTSVNFFNLPGPKVGKNTSICALEIKIDITDAERYNLANKELYDSLKKQIEYMNECKEFFPWWLPTYKHYLADVIRYPSGKSLKFMLLFIVDGKNERWVSDEIMPFSEPLYEQLRRLEARNQLTN